MTKMRENEMKYSMGLKALFPKMIETQMNWDEMR